MGQIPRSAVGHQDPKSNVTASPITASNKSAQTPQAAAQNVPQGDPSHAGAGILSGAGAGVRRIRNGKIGGRYGRGA